jgi:hypothetical protein
MDYRPAELVRLVDPSEELDEVVNEAKADTWVKGREHAVLSLADGRLVMVRGGRDGIELMRTDESGVCIDVEGRRVTVRKLCWHVHPVPTGPSDHDRRLLDLLGQDVSVLYEIGGEPDGTIYRGMTHRSA